MYIHAYYIPTYIHTLNTYTKYIHVYTYIHTYVYMHIYIHMYTCIYTYTLISTIDSVSSLGIYELSSTTSKTEP